MVKAAAQLGWIDGDAVALEHLHRDQARRRRLRAHVLRARGRRAACSVVSSRRCSSGRSARIPGGVELAGARRSASVGGEPFFVARGEGAYLVDTDGRRYLDYVQSWGASILGHAHPGGRRGGAARRGRRHVVRRADRARGRARRGDLRRGCRRSRRCGSCRRAPRRDDRGPPRARRDRAGEDREVRRLLPRSRRRAARRGGQWRRDARAPRLGGRHRRAPSPTRSSCPTTTTTALDAAFAEHGDRARGGARRAGRRQHGPRRARAPASSRGCASAAPRPARCSCSTR